MDEKLFESKFLGDIVEVFKTHISITQSFFGIKMFGGIKVIPISEIASVEAPMGKRLKIVTTAGKKHFISLGGFGRNKDNEFIEAVMKAKTQI